MDKIAVHIPWFKAGFQFACGFAVAQLILMLIAVIFMAVLG